MPSDYERTVRSLDAIVREQLPDQILDGDREDDGGYFSAGDGFASAAGTSGFLARLGHAYLAPPSTYFEDDDVLDRIERGAAFMRRRQRPSGCIDLPAANYDSPPDTAFAVARLAPVARIARRREDVAGAGAVADALEPFLVDAGDGMADGGFHTANHRWVLVGALAGVHELYPHDRYRERIEAYLAEGIDSNDDGEYSERSHAVYTNVVNRHLIAAAEALDRPALLEPVRESLHTMLDLMDADWTVLTELSTRQDRGRRTVPTRGAAEFYYAARSDGDGRLAAGARALLDEGGWERGGVLAALLSHFERHPGWKETDLPDGERPDSVSRRMADSGLWRLRDGRFSATVATGTKNVVSVSYGTAALVGLQVTSPYFGGEFEGGDIDFGEGRADVTMASSYWHPALPGYFEPLDRPVEWGALELDERAVDERPDFDIDVGVERVADGLDVTVSITEGLSRVPFALEARFDPGGRLELPSGSVPGTTGEPTFLDAGHATYVHDGDAIRIGPGVREHRISDPPGADDPDDVVRVLLTDWSPLERTVSIRAGHRSALAGDEP